MYDAASRDKKMQRLVTLITGATIAFLFLSSTWFADHPLVSTMSNDGSSVILVRHGDAPGRGEPDGFDLSDCSTQRNLSDEGRNEARDLGAMFRARGINVMKVLTSRWCRARETAELMKLGPIEDAAAFDDLLFNKRHAIELLDEEHKLIASWHGPGVLLVVSHGSNIKALTGVDLEQGAMVVVSMKQGQLFAKAFSAYPVMARLNCAGCF
jgi:phosphohistidine phosphatase SixA